jgi:hypothetical protein
MKDQLQIKATCRDNAATISWPIKPHFWADELILPWNWRNKFHEPIFPQIWFSHSYLPNPLPVVAHKITCLLPHIPICVDEILCSGRLGTALRFASRFSPTSQGLPLLKGTVLWGAPPSSLSTPMGLAQNRETKSYKFIHVHLSNHWLLIIFWVVNICYPPVN